MTNQSATRLRAVLFDLDGTLIDHFDTLHRCYRYALENLGLPAPSREVVRRSVGGSMEVTMRRFVDEAHFAEAARLWREQLARIYLDDVRLMPGAARLVETLHARGLKLGVLTNKTGEHSRAIMRHLGLAPRLDLVLGANDTPYRKPQPQFSALALERLGATAQETCLVGDSPFDIEAARVAGMRGVCVATGTHNADELHAAGADAVYDDLDALGLAEFVVESIPPEPDGHR